eukprot:4464945-Pleurochrysis_carterae.AAC.1
MTPAHATALASTMGSVWLGSTPNPCVELMRPSLSDSCVDAQIALAVLSARPVKTHDKFKGEDE